MTEITIPVEGVKLDGNTVYKLKGLEASTTYEVTLTSDKFVDLEITEDKDDKPKVLASGALYNAPFKFTATATTARLVVEAPTGANLTLTAKQATAAPAAVGLVSPAKPNTLYKKTGLTVGKVYEVAVSGNVPHVVQMAWEGGTILPPLVAVDGTVQVTAQTVQLNLWLDSAEDAEITITEATSILPVTGVPTAVSELGDGQTNITLPMGSPKGLYRVDLEIHDTGATAFDSTLTASGGSPILDNVAGVKDDTGSLFAAPLEAGVVKGVRDMRGSIIYSAPGALSQPLILATYKTATGSNGWSGKAVISYLGPIS